MMAEDVIHILMIEDNPADVELIRDVITDFSSDLFEPRHPVLSHFSRLSAGLGFLADNEVHLILLDLGLPDSLGFETYNELRRHAPDVPVVILSGMDDQEMAVRMVQAGAQDYLIKGQSDGESIIRSIRYAIERNQLLDELAQKQRELLSRRDLLYRLIEKNADAMLVLDRVGKVLFSNPAAAALFGEDPARMVGQVVTLPLDVHRPIDWKVNRQQGEPCDVEIRTVELEWEGEAAWLASLHDMTHRKLAERILRLNALVFETAQEGILITDADANILEANQGFTTITGFTQEDVRGKNPRILASGRHTREFYADLWNTLLTQDHWEGEIWNRRKNGEMYPEWMSISAVRDDSGKLINFVGMFSDITTRKEIESRLYFLASHDILTGLPNRVLFRDRLDQALLRAERSHRQVAVLFLDLDGFKQVNDTYGHPVGDLLLQEIARRLQESVRRSDTVSRPSGDEFTLLLENIKSEDETRHIGEKILEAIEVPYTVHEKTIQISASLGISFFPEDGKDAETLINMADQAMYRVKRAKNLPKYL